MSVTEEGVGFCMNMQFESSDVTNANLMFKNVYLWLSWFDCLTFYATKF